LNHSAQVKLPISILKGENQTGAERYVNETEKKSSPLHEVKWNREGKIFKLAMPATN
jgi:hypothetical protein